MKNGFFLITGTSRGIGEALTQKILKEGHTVLGVSRNRSDSLKSANFYHLPFDLTEISRLHRIMEKTNEVIAGRDFDFICLVNNASATKPLNPVEKCPPDEIESHIKIGLMTPMLLTSLFIKRFEGKKIRKKVAFMSSGAALHPLADMSIYCGSKAGEYMFARCVGAEQQEREYGFEIISIGPGMVETSMQKEVRSKTSEEFAMADYFRQAYDDGKVQKPGQVAEKIYTILLNHYEQGKYISVTEM